MQDSWPFTMQNIALPFRILYDTEYVSYAGTPQNVMIITPRTAKKEGIGDPRSRVFWQLCTIKQQGALL